MNNSTRFAKYHFALICVGVIAALSSLLVLHWPSVVMARWRAIDALVASAKTQKTPAAKYSLLVQAQMLDRADPVAIEALASFYKDRGEANKALDIYESSIDQPSYLYLGNLSLETQQYQKAISYFSQAKPEGESKALIGLSRAAYNTANTQEGCEHAQNARKLDLSNSSAEALVQICEQLGGKVEKVSSQTPAAAKLSKVELAYLLLGQKVFVAAEKTLLELGRKSAADYYWLAKISSANGDTQKAAHYLQEARLLQPGNQFISESQRSIFDVLEDAKAQKNLENQQEDLQRLIENK